MLWLDHISRRAKLVAASMIAAIVPLGESVA
jgi:hypothetical protein